MFGRKQEPEPDTESPAHPILARLWPELAGADLADVLGNTDRDEREAQRWLEERDD